VANIPVIQIPSTRTTGGTSPCISRGEGAFERAKRKNLLVETVQLNRAVQPAIQIDFDLPIAQPAAVLGLDFQAEIVPNLFPGAQRLKHQVNIPSTPAFGLGHLQVDATSLQGQLMQVMTIAPKILMLMAAALPMWTIFMT
jgi:hypothetical protein